MLLGSFLGGFSIWISFTNRTLKKADNILSPNPYIVENSSQFQIRIPIQIQDQNKFQSSETLKMHVDPSSSPEPGNYKKKIDPQNCRKYCTFDIFFIL